MSRLRSSRAGFRLFGGTISSGPPNLQHPPNTAETLAHSPAVQVTEQEIMGTFTVFQVSICCRLSPPGTPLPSDCPQRLFGSIGASTAAASLGLFTLPMCWAFLHYLRVVGPHSIIRRATTVLVCPGDLLLPPSSSWRPNHVAATTGQQPGLGTISVCTTTHP